MEKNIVFQKTKTDAVTLTERRVILFEGTPPYLMLWIRFAMFRLRIMQKVTISGDGHRMTIAQTTREVEVIPEANGVYFDADSGRHGWAVTDDDRSRAATALADLDPAEVERKIEAAIAAALTMDPIAIVDGEKS